jgi:8-oxo-dGTP diphosphatase
LENIKGDVKISEEHTDWMWANLEKIKSLEISTSLKKILEKRNWEI